MSNKPQEYKACVVKDWKGMLTWYQMIEKFPAGRHNWRYSLLNVCASENELLLQARFQQCTYIFGHNAHPVKHSSLLLWCKMLRCHQLLSPSVSNEYHLSFQEAIKSSKVLNLHHLSHPPHQLSGRRCTGVSARHPEGICEPGKSNPGAGECKQTRQFSVAQYWFLPPEQLPWTSAVCPVLPLIPKDIPHRNTVHLHGLFKGLHISQSIPPVSCSTHPGKC